MDIIGKRNIFLGFSGILVAASIVCVVVWGLKPGIDLRGGTQWQLTFEGVTPAYETIREAFRSVNPSIEVSIKQGEGGSMFLRLPEISEAEHQAYGDALRKLGKFEENNFSSIGPTIGSELRRKSLWAMLLVLTGISLYIAWAFRKVSEPIASWKYGVVTLLTLLHDVSIPTGMLAVLGRWKGVEIDTNFIVALLVVMGFSVHDTIVVFDRIREHLLHARSGKIRLHEVVNQSVRETLARSVNTSLTLVFVLVAILLFGPSSLFYFVLTILVGTIFGTYSSIFVASPLLHLWGRKTSS